MVAVYSPIGTYAKHAVSGYYFHNFRDYGVNIVVTRYPVYARRSPRVAISTIVGSVSGNDPKAIRDSIRNKFIARGESYNLILVIRKIDSRNWLGGTKTVGYSIWRLIPDNNYFFKKFSDVIVVVVAPSKYGWL